MKLIFLWRKLKLWDEQNYELLDWSKYDGIATSEMEGAFSLGRSGMVHWLPMHHKKLHRDTYKNMSSLCNSRALQLCMHTWHYIMSHVHHCVHASLHGVSTPCMRCITHTHSTEYNACIINTKVSHVQLYQRHKYHHCHFYELTKVIVWWWFLYSPTLCTHLIMQSMNTMYEMHNLYTFY